MARRGRKRNIGLRHPGGELVRPQFDFRGLATLQPYWVWLPQEKRLDQKAGKARSAASIFRACFRGGAGRGRRSE
jgi:hypothetical protein